MLEEFRCSRVYTPVERIGVPTIEVKISTGGWIGLMVVCTVPGTNMEQNIISPSQEERDLGR